MFSSFPSFEELIIHLQVEWGDYPRPVEVRLERWPQSSRAVLVCHFEDDLDYGEWVVLDGSRRPHFVGRPEKLLCARAQWDIDTRQLFTTRHFKDKRLERLKTVVRSAFAGDNFQIARVLEISDLPEEPRLLVWHSGGAWWCRDWDLGDGAHFDWSPSPLHLSARQMQDAVPVRWDEAESDMRFAWQWAQWSDIERVRRSTGYENYQGNYDELEQVMKWVLTCLPMMGGQEMKWTWGLCGNRQGEPSEVVYWLHAYSEEWENMEGTPAGNLIEAWSDLLGTHFLPAWRRDWMEDHVCVREFWNFRSLAEIELSEPPTMHERLETRLELRDWLQRNAPERMDLFPD